MARTSATASQIGCRSEDVRVYGERYNSSGTTWNATCEGQEYACAQSNSGNVACSASREAASERPALLRSSRSGAPAPSAHPRATPSRGGAAEVKRGYDEGREAHFVTGTFGLDHALNVIISGAPKVARGTISVTLQGHVSRSSVRNCEAVQVLVNGEPISTDRNTPTRGYGVKIESRFDFQVFRPLAGRFPVFGVRACGTSWSFTPEQTERLRALLVVYSDMAEALEGSEEQTPGTAPGQTAL